MSAHLEMNYSLIKMNKACIISYLSIFIGEQLITSINPVNNLFAFTRQHALLFIHQHTPSLFDLYECGINMLLFCNVSRWLTLNLSRVNNESDDLHVQGIEETS